MQSFKNPTGRLRPRAAHHVNRKCSHILVRAVLVLPAWYQGSVVSFPDFKMFSTKIFIMGYRGIIMAMTDRWADKQKKTTTTKKKKKKKKTGVGESEEEDSDDAPLSEVSKQSSKSFQKPTGPVTVSLGTSSSFLFFRRRHVNVCTRPARAPHGACMSLMTHRLVGPHAWPYDAHTGPVRGPRGPRTTFTCLLRVKYHRKPVSESCASSISATGYIIRRPSGSKILQNVVRARDSLILVRTGPVNCPGVTVAL